MQPHNLTYGVVTDRVMAGVTAGTTSTTSASVDMLGFAAVRFVALFGALTASQVTNIKAQGSSDNSSFSDLTGTATSNMADTDSNKLLILDIFKPQHRYVRVSVQRGTANAVIDGVIAEQYRPGFEAVTANADVAYQEIHTSPAAGTA